jgi:hypothetical protein
MKFITLKSVAFLLAAVLTVVPLGCKLSHNKVGKLVGVSAQLGGQSDNATFKYLGTVTVRLNDNTEVDAECDEALVKTLHGGQRLEIEPLDDKGKWKVVRALN